MKEPSFYGALNIASQNCTLFMPRLPNEYKIWCGDIHPPADFKLSYAVDDVLYLEDMSAWLTDHLSEMGDSGKLYLIDGVNSDSGSRATPASFEGLEQLKEKQKVDYTTLFDILSNCRVIKSAYEIDVMRYCAYVASNAHVEVMRSAKDCSIEYELEAKFLYEIYRNGGCRRCAYTSICACGPNSAVLHYGHAGAPNDRPLLSTDMALLDMGAEYHGYVSDITCSVSVTI